METVANSKPNLQILADTEKLARRCLDIFVDTALGAVRQNDVFFVAISGGHTPKRFFELLADGTKAKAMPWQKTHLFWVDERCVPPNSPSSNYKLAAETFLKKVPLPDENVHRIPAELEDFNLAARRYEDTIRSVFALKPGRIPTFDLIVLGMGADGHTGSLFPDSYASFDKQGLACVVYFLDQKIADERLNRITLTHPVLCAASRLLVLVSGEEKAKIIKQVLTSEPDEVRYPIHALWPALDKVTFLLDADAAKLL